MNRVYTEKLLDCLPDEQRKKILRSKIKGSVPGFRTMDRAPLSILKKNLKSDERFAFQFLDAVTDVYGCPLKRYADEEYLPELTRENFWGIFAQKCRTLDDSQESGKILEELLQEYAELSTSDFPNSEEGLEIPSRVSENLYQEDSGGVDGKTDESSSVGFEEEEEDYMSEFTQYIGYIQEINGFYNFLPICVVKPDSIEALHPYDVKSRFPEYGNINLYSQERSYVGTRFNNKDIIVLELTESDLYDNVWDGVLRKTNYKVDIKKLDQQGKVKRLVDIKMYPVVHPIDKIDFANKLITMKEAYGDINDPCMIEEDGILYGPYEVKNDVDGKAFVNTNGNYIISSYQAQSGTLDYIVNQIDIPETPQVFMFIRIDDKLVHKQLDKIPDQELFEAFLSSIESRKDYRSNTITTNLVDEYVKSTFHGLSEEIIHDRVRRIQQFIEEQFRQEEALTDISRFVADILFRYGESDYFSDLLNLVLSNSDLARKIQSFTIVKQRLTDMQQQYEEIQRQCIQEQEKLDAEAKDQEAQFFALAESTNDTIRNLKAQKETLLQEIEELKRYKDGLKSVVDLDREKERLDAINDDLREKERQLREKGDEAVSVLQEKLKQATTNAVDTAFEGRIADQIFQAAAGWNQCSQKELLQKIADQLTGTTETGILTGEELVEYLLTSVKRYRPGYTRNEILNIFISISQNFLTVFSGEPGTGKTSICNIVAHILGTSLVPSLVENGEGMELGRYVPISIERGWTSKRDFIGYYNPLSKTFEHANKHLYDGLRLLDAEGEQSKYPYIVLLDEANLSPIEYYWADFMNICDRDSRFNNITLGNDIQLKIPPTLRFMATINNDDTTERLSPRLIDRAALIRLPEIPYTKVEDENLTNTDFVNVVEWANLQAVFAPDAALDLDAMPNEIYKNICNLFRESMKFTISPRVDRAIKRYWVAAKSLFESEDGNDTTIIALDYAIAQKLLPKINGSGKAYLEFLRKFQELCERNNLEKSRVALINIIKRGEASMDYYQYF